MNKQLNIDDTPIKIMNYVHYTTRHGVVDIDYESKKIVFACLGFTCQDITSPLNHVSIRVINNEFSIRLGSIYKCNTEFASKGFPFKLSYVSKTPLNVALYIIQQSFVPSKGVVYVLMYLIKCFSFCLKGKSKSALKKLSLAILLNATHKIKRTSIKVKRKSIKYNINQSR